MLKELPKRGDGGRGCRREEMRMAKKEIIYYRSDRLEMIYSRDSKLSYPPHNHVSVYTVGIVLNGEVAVIRKDGGETYTRGMSFAILPYEVHALKAEREYELFTICIGRELLEGEKRSMAEEESALFQSQKRIRENPEEVITVEALAKEAFMSEYHFIRVFREKIGLTPHRFLMQNRIRKAQRLLERGCPLAEVAFAAGFYDQSHFNRQFRYWLGLTPMEYKAASVNAGAAQEQLSKGEE